MDLLRIIRGPMPFISLLGLANLLHFSQVLLNWEMYNTTYVFVVWSFAAFYTSL